MQHDFQQFEQVIGVSFQNRPLLLEAFTHPSYLHENDLATGRDYQRLEFLGDSILGMLLAEMIFRRYPDWDEGRLSRLRARLAGQSTLADRARTLDIGQYILFGRGEKQSVGREKDSILADVLEALIAAIYLDAGLDAARGLIFRLFDGLVASPCSLSLGHDSKSELQELLSAQGAPPPEYRLINESGPPHDPLFSFEISVAGQFLGKGTGKSKKMAQQAAAAHALKMLRTEGTEAA